MKESTFKAILSNIDEILGKGACIEISDGDDDSDHSIRKSLFFILLKKLNLNKK